MSDLHKYYKYVRLCNRCNQEYGSDQKEEEYMNVCPKCYQGRGRYSKSGWRGGKRSTSEYILSLLNGRKV